MAETDNKFSNRRSKPQHQSMYDAGGRMQPRDKDLEEAVLGALCLKKTHIPKYVISLSPIAFMNQPIS